ncbi:DUF4350 domain-containing protein [Arthrobacter sp. Sa2CUA1]|uniref:DUF4350 domain-containing protein n=1 Tax=Arthrobacter gallicola TaxID=2762225 RepID=A0ABR8US35_9MICC|nr:DUF4350 domain-containing protein [Arthrobacter gallicola]MBD7995366.1 DUF4350 domain-containing protein [Arthrobacter gallicola]
MSAVPGSTASDPASPGLPLPGSTEPGSTEPGSALPGSTEPGSAGFGRDEAPAPGSGSLRRKLRTWRLWIILAAVLAATVVLGLFGGSGGDRAALSAGNSAPQGAQALARVLQDRGVDVVVVQDHAAAVAALQTPGAALLLFDPNEYLSSGQLTELGTAAAKTVLVEPTFTQLARLAPEIAHAGLIPQDVLDRGTAIPAGCTDTAAQAAGSVTPGGLAYRGPVTCFPVTSAGPPAGLYASSPDGTQTVLGYTGLLANETIADSGNAALALHTLGSTGTLVWYLPTASDIPASAAPADPLSLLPGWVNPLLAWVLVVAALAAFWRGRRMGPLALEPMPIVVRASETADGRARLYQDSRALDRAAANLRAATLTRLAARLRLGPGSSAGAVVESAARATGRSAAELDNLLKRSMPTTDSALVIWSQELLDLEEEISES